MKTTRRKQWGNILSEHFSQRTYYRIRKGERLPNPAEQEEVINIFRNCGFTREIEFDVYYRKR